MTKENLILIPVMAILLIVPFMVVNPTEDGFVLAKVVSFQLLTIAAFLFFAFQGRFKPVPVKLLIPLAVLLLISAFSMLISDFPWYSLREFFKLLSLLIFFYLVSAIDDKNSILILIWTAVIAGSFMALLGIMEYLNAGIPWVKPKTTQVQIWATLGNSNLVAQYMAGIIPLTCGLLWLTAGWRKRLALGAVIAVELICLFLTHSKGAWLGLVTAAVIFGVWSLPEGRKIKGAAAALAGVIVACGLVLFFKGNINRETNPVQRDSENLSYQGRITLYQSTLNLMLAKPLLGWGPGNYYRYFPKYKTAEFDKFLPYRRPKRAHNDFLQLGAETGILGLGAFIWFLIAYYRFAMGHQGKSPSAKLLGDFPQTPTNVAKLSQRISPHLTLCNLPLEIAKRFQGLSPGKPLVFSGKNCEDTVPEISKKFLGVSRGQEKFLKISLIVSATAILVHSFFDFSLQMPASSMVFWFVLGSMVSMCGSPGREKVSDYKPALVAVPALLTVFFWHLTYKPFISTLYQVEGMKSLLSEQNLQKAKEEFVRATEWDAYSTTAHLSLGKVYLGTGDIPAAAEEFRKAKKLDNYIAEEAVIHGNI